jgi:hypothetical protein
MSGGVIRAARRDDGGIIAGLVIKVCLAVVVVGLAIHDGGQITRAQVKAQSAARAGASAAAEMYADTHSQPRAPAEAAGAAVVTESGARVTKVQF